MIVRDNPLWGEARIANEWLLKLRIRISPRAVGPPASGWTTQEFIAPSALAMSRSCSILVGLLQWSRELAIADVASLGQLYRDGKRPATTIL